MLRKYFWHSDFLSNLAILYGLCILKSNFLYLTVTVQDVSTKHCLLSFLAGLYKSTGIAIAVTTASVLALALALHKMLKFLVKVFKSLYLLNPWMDLVDTCLILDTGLKFYVVPSRPTSVTLRSRSQTSKF